MSSNDRTQGVYSAVYEAARLPETCRMGQCRSDRPHHWRKWLTGPGAPAFSPSLLAPRQAINPQNAVVS